MTARLLRQTRMLELWHDEGGATMAEYTLLMALIALGTLAAMTTFADEVVAIFNSSSTSISAARTSGS